MAPHAIHGHTAVCEAWKASRGKPWPQFKYSYSRAKYLPGLVEGVDFLRCHVCLTNGWDFRFNRLVQHLAIHGLSESEYLSLFPSKLVRLALTNERRKASVRAKYGVDFIAQVEECKEKSRNTMVEHYGVPSAMQSEDVRAKATKTNLERYGSENPFGSKEVQKKIRKTLLSKYGVANPQQVSDIRTRTLQTNKERYGSEHFFQTPDFDTVRAATCQERYGAPHHMQSVEGRANHEAAFIAKYGVPNPFLIPEIRDRAYATNVANHGGVHALAHPDVIAARKRNLLALYGVDNISKVPAIKDKIIAKVRASFSGAPKRTTPERIVEGFSPECVVYSGDWSYWVTWANGYHKNPDFVILTPQQLEEYKAGAVLNALRTSKVIEVNGDFWHTKYRGVTREEREQQFFEGYASIGVTCLILWELDLYASTSDAIRAKVEAFCCS